MDGADRVVLSYRIHGDGREEWVRAALAADSYVTYLRRVHDGPVAVGDEYEEFVSRGCGSPTDLTLRVESVEGGSVLTPETELTFEPAGE